MYKLALEIKVDRTKRGPGSFLGVELYLKKSTPHPPRRVGAKTGDNPSGTFVSISYHSKKSASTTV